MMKCVISETYPCDEVGPQGGCRQLDDTERVPQVRTGEGLQKRKKTALTQEPIIHDIVM